jgi:hypothetical protein
MKDKEQAKVAYQKFLDKYPKDEDPNEKMIESAKMMLQMLQENKSIEDIIKNVQPKEQKDTTKVNNKEQVKEQKKEKVKDNPDDLKTDDRKVPPTKK